MDDLNITGWVLLIENEESGRKPQVLPIHPEYFPDEDAEDLLIESGKILLEVRMGVRP
jgi:hypothetical protein